MKIYPQREAVVILTKPSESGGQQTVRLWIVDQDGSAALEHGDPSFFWMRNLLKIYS